INHRLKQTQIVPKQKDNGLVRVVKYSSSNLIAPLVKEMLSTDLTGSTCVLTHRNDDALQIAGLLTKGGLSAKLIQSNDGFSLYDLLEVRFFMEQLEVVQGQYIIDESTWKNAKRRLWDTYRDSSNIETCINIIKDFDSSHPKKKYRSDFEMFVKESKLEDFTNTMGETINVSTIHKSKGKEFDNVFLMLDGYSLDSD